MSDRVRRRSPRKLGWLVAVGLLAAAERSAWASTQHLVAAGQDLAAVAKRVRPGDEIVLMPGRHDPATIVDLAGKPGDPITIRGFNERNPGVIRADAYGLVLVRPRYVVLKDLRIQGPRLAGVVLSDSDPAAEAPTGEPTPADVLVSRVEVEGGGRDVEPNGIVIAGLANVRLEDCVVRDWGGAAVRVTGAWNVAVEGCHLEGRDDRRERAGIEIGGGARNVRVHRCEIVHAGVAGVRLGADGRVSDFRPRPADDAKPASVDVVVGVSVVGCVFRGGDAAFLFGGVRDADVRRNTIADPGVCVAAFARGIEDARIRPTGRVTFGQNLFVWDAQAVARPLLVGEGASTEDLVWEANLWWGGEPAPTGGIDLPGTVAFEQVWDVPAVIDGTGSCAAPAAKGFGAIEPGTTATGGTPPDGSGDGIG